MKTDKPILDYLPPPPPKRFLDNFRWMDIRVPRWVALLSIVLVIAAPVLLAYYQNRGIKERANRVKCASNLRQIGQAIELYVADQKQLPDSFERLVATCDLSPECFICPSTDDRPVDIPHLSDLLSKPGHNSYLYFAANQPLDWYQPPQTDQDSCGCSTDVSGKILACENPKNHDDNGANILFADGQVFWCSTQLAKHMISELNAGFNPPRPFNPATQPVK